MKTYRDLVVWQKAMSFVLDIYRATKSFPSEELYGLVSQMRRCAVSIPSNIAEGYGRRSMADYVRFLQIAMASVFELQTQMELALGLKYWGQREFDSLYAALREIERMLSSLIRKVRES